MKLSDLLTEATVSFRDTATTRNKAIGFLGNYFADGELAVLVKDKTSMNALVAFLAKEVGIKLVKGSYTLTDKALAPLSTSVFDTNKLPSSVKKVMGLKSTATPKKKMTMATSVKSEPKVEEPKKEETKKPTINWNEIISTLNSNFKSGSYMSRANIDTDRNGDSYVDYEFRNWGQWEPDSDTDPEDYEDNDFEVLSDRSYTEFKSIIQNIKNSYPTISIDVDFGEKNWITLTVTAKK